MQEGQAVHKGDVLFRLDDRQFRIAVESARANLAQTRLQLEAMKRDYQRMQRDIAARAAQVQADQAPFDRANGLVGRGDVPARSYDDARFGLAGRPAGLESAKVAGAGATGPARRQRQRRRHHLAGLPAGAGPAWTRRSASWTTPPCARRSTAW